MPDPLTGRCYCGAVTFRAGVPQTVAYCHCADCKRWTGAPLPAFAAFAKGDVVMTPGPEARIFPSGVRRWMCAACGSPMAAEFPYLPDQVYVPLGVIDQAETMPPRLHAYADAALPWLHLDDGVPRVKGSSRDSLAKAAAP